MRLLTCLVVVLWFASPATPQEVLSARPTVKVESNAASTQRFQLSDAEQEEFRVVITTRDGRYYWISREGRELIYHASGAFHYFIDPTGGGYIKVFDTSLVPEFLRDPGPRFQYFEVLSLWLGTITYWGASEDFRLDGKQE